MQGYKPKFSSLIIFGPKQFLSVSLEKGGGGGVLVHTYVNDSCWSPATFAIQIKVEGCHPKLQSRTTNCPKVLFSYPIDPVAMVRGL